MIPIEPNRIAEGPAMLLAGLRRTHAFADAPSRIPQQWTDFERMGPPPGRVGEASYGVICGASVEERWMEYMCAVQVQTLHDVPPEYGRVRITGQTYAVFTHAGGASTVGSTWDAIWGDWLPRSGYQAANAPDFELYEERFDPVSGSGIIEIWVPIQSG